jgi:hypothetical protein
VIGGLRVKEPTHKLGLRLSRGTARILRATLVSDGATTFVSFSVLVRRDKPDGAPAGVSATMSASHRSSPVLTAMS